ncbi:MAG: OmpA family protein [Pseudomonadota bacterium]|nr:OmpA family protein [Pseudomonadota bacterium]
MLPPNIHEKISPTTLFIFLLFIFTLLPTTVKASDDTMQPATSRDAFTVPAEPVKKQATGLDRGNYELVVDSETISHSLQSEKRLINLKIEFTSGSAKLSESANQQIIEIAGALQSKALIDEKIMITGHTDNIGSAKSNLELSRKRALSVKRALVNLGIDNFLLSSQGRGESEPLADNQNAAGRARNRRVTLSRQ